MAADPWQGTILNATKEGSKCLQQNTRANKPVEGDEDCLFLNVYTHSVTFIYTYILYTYLILKKFQIFPYFM